MHDAHEHPSCASKAPPRTALTRPPHFVGERGAAALPQGEARRSASDVVAPAARWGQGLGFREVGRAASCVKGIGQDSCAAACKAVEIYGGDCEMIDRRVWRGGNDALSPGQNLQE